MQKIKITKRQKKAAKPNNAMVKACIKLGNKVVIGGVNYFGRNPVFNLETGKKIADGIPFVRGL